MEGPIRSHMKLFTAIACVLAGAVGVAALENWRYARACFEQHDREACFDASECLFYFRRLAAATEGCRLEYEGACINMQALRGDFDR